MQTDDARRSETEELIEAIWGPTSVATTPDPVDPAVRARQNRALAEALVSYLNQYLDEL